MLAAAESSRGGAAELRTPGLLFEPAGQLTVATGRWTLVIRLQDQEVRKQEGRIREQIDGITEALSDSRKQIPRSDGEGGEEEELRQMRRFYMSAERAWTQERRWMLRELDMAGEKVTGTLKEGRVITKLWAVIHSSDRRVGMSERREHDANGTTKGNLPRPQRQVSGCFCCPAVRILPSPRTAQ